MHRIETKTQKLEAAKRQHKDGGSTGTPALTSISFTSFFYEGWGELSTTLATLKTRTRPILDETRTDFNRTFAAGEGSASVFSPKQLSPSPSS